MTGLRFLNTHKTWEDWCGVMLGALIVLSPWFAGEASRGEVVINAVLIGLLVLVLAQLELLVVQRWEEIFEFVIGLWLMASPFVFGYAASGSLRFWHFILGGLVALIGALELWQDWNKSDSELAKRGQ